MILCKVLVRQPDISIYKGFLFIHATNEFCSVNWGNKAAQVHRADHGGHVSTECHAV